ncbi:MAG: hypothetical protein E7012_02660 [Alphaproteobacteria bacterium]|nr:hypothetical protein [Alphaproteobacteria bacterium]
METDANKLYKYNCDYKKWLKQFPNQCFAYENNMCGSFAHLLALAATNDGYKSHKICAFSSKREPNGGVSANMPLEDNSGFNKVWWEFHVACIIEVPIYKDCNKTEFLVADPVLFGDKLATLKQWCWTLDCDIDKLSILKLNKDKNSETDASKKIEALNNYICSQQNKHQVNPFRKIKKYRPIKSTLIKTNMEHTTKNKAPCK